MVVVVACHCYEIDFRACSFPTFLFLPCFALLARRSLDALVVHSDLGGFFFFFGGVAVRCMPYSPKSIFGSLWVHADPLFIATHPEHLRIILYVAAI